MCLAAIAVGAATQFAWGEEPKEQKAAPPVNVFIALPDDALTIGMGDLARIDASVVAGGKVDVKVIGPAKTRRLQLIRVVNGEKVIGELGGEVEVTPTAKGRITVELTKKSFDNSKTVEKYVIEVK
jgi:hypothetical protein